MVGVTDLKHLANGDIGLTLQKFYLHKKGCHKLNLLGLNSVYDYLAKLVQCLTYFHKMAFSLDLYLAFPFMQITWTPAVEGGVGIRT